MALPSSGPLSLNDIQTEFGGTNPIGMNEYYAGGGLVPAGTSGTYGAVPSSGTISIQNFYGTSALIPVYIEEVFSTWVYTGNSTTNTITNGINLSSNGGLVWTKGRGNFSENHAWVDTNRGTNKYLASNNTDAEGTGTQLTSFNTNGYTLGSVNGWEGNWNGRPYVSWTFRKQPKFFDIVTYTGNGSDQNIAHNLGSVPGFVVIKRTDTAGNWSVWHRSIGNTYLILNTTAKAEGTGNPARTVTSTTFQIYGNFPDEGANGSSYVMYLFAHDAGGFGATGTDNVITCGSYTGNGSNAGPTINLGYEPQWLLYKNASNAANWGVIDNMRGWSTVPFGSYTGDQILRPNLASAEFADDLFSITSTGFQVVGTDPTNNYNGQTYIYIAIRRGPMKTPTTGTSVFVPTLTSASTGTAVTTNIVTDMHWANYLDGDGQNTTVFDRLRGITSTSSYNPNLKLVTSSADAESNSQGPAGYAYSFGNTGWVQGFYASGASSIRYDFRRAPGFFDVVCYTGTGSATTQAHNLGVVPEMMIVKSRSSGTYNWNVYIASASSPRSKYLNLNTTGALGTTTNFWGSSGPTSTTFSLDTWASNNDSGATYVAYLFASCPGVSKVGSYTGTGALQTIDCGFTGGARFVLIKRTDSTGDWFTYDSARGISSGNDPYLLMNSTAAQVTGTNYVDTTSVGFQVTAAAPAGLNANGGTYIFLAIA